jgi:hypothetical protein
VNLTYLLIHEIEVLCLGVQGSDLLNLAAVTVEAVIIVKADDSGHVTNQGVAIGVASLRGDGVATENSGNTAHESGLTAARIGSETNNHHLIIGSTHHNDTAGGSARGLDCLNSHSSTERSGGLDVGNLHATVNPIDMGVGAHGDAGHSHWLESLSRRHLGIWHLDQSIYTVKEADFW